MTISSYSDRFRLGAMAVISFGSRALRRLFENDDTRGISGRHVYRVRDILLALDQAMRIDDMNAYPGWRLHPLKGDLRGFWSVSVREIGA